MTNKTYIDTSVDLQMNANNNVTTSLGAKFHGTEFQISYYNSWVFTAQTYAMNEDKISNIAIYKNTRIQDQISIMSRQITCK